MNKFAHDDFRKLLQLMNQFFGNEGIGAIINIMANNKESNDIAMTMQNLFTQSKIYELRNDDTCMKPTIYFLFLRGKLQYIGQSISVVSRVRQHKFDPTKSFDKVFYMNCAEEDLDEMEERLIKHYSPPQNRTPHAKGKSRRNKSYKNIFLDTNKIDDQLINNILNN